MSDVERHDRMLERAREVLGIERDAITSVAGALGHDFCAAADRIIRCLADGRKVVTTGVGKNLHIAEKLSATLASTGTTSVVLNPTQAMHGDLGMLSEGDILLALSYSGESEELLALLPAVKRLGVVVIGLTGVATSTLAGIADLAVVVSVPREACPFNLAPTASTTATLAVGDALAMVLLEARGFKEADYANYHPAGAIGRALLMKVRDIMRARERLALVPQTATVREALFAMTGARSGSTAVVDADECLVGIFTDGDLRRHITEDTAILDRPVADFMTRSPLTVEADQLAALAVRMFEEHSVDDLLVVENRRVVGAIDSQDLPKLKIL